MSFLKFFKKKQKKVIANPESLEGNFDILLDTRDGKKYKTVKIGNQVWMAENLAYKANVGRWTNRKTSVKKHGYIYKLEAAINSCPLGWHLPSDEEWDKLVNFIINVGRKNEVETVLKSKKGWKNNNNGTDDYGFNAIPTPDEFTTWWTSTNASHGTTGCRSLRHDSNKLDSFYANRIKYGNSVRCIKD